MPTIAVVMPVWNGERYIGAAIESVLRQTFADFTLYVYNDGSTDGTAAIVRAVADSRLRLVEETRNRGVSAIRRRALETLSEDWIACLDADDLALPDRLEKQLALVAANPKLVAVGSALECIDEDGRRLGFRRYPLRADEIRQRLPIENCVAQPAVLFHRQSAIEAGGYPDDLDGAEDYSLWLRMARVGDIENHPEPLTRYRLHGGQFKSARTRRQIRATLATRLEALRLGYPASIRFWATWVALAALLLLPGSAVVWLFRRRSIEAQLPREQSSS